MRTPIARSGKTLKMRLPAGLHAAFRRGRGEAQAEDARALHQDGLGRRNRP